MVSRRRENMQGSRGLSGQAPPPEEQKPDAGRPCLYAIPARNTHRATSRASGRTGAPRTRHTGPPGPHGFPEGSRRHLGLRAPRLDGGPVRARLGALEALTGPLRG